MARKTLQKYDLEKIDRQAKVETQKLAEVALEMGVDPELIRHELELEGDQE